MKVETLLSLCLVAQLCLTLCNPMDCSRQAPLSRGFFRQEYLRGLTFPPPWDLPDPEIELVSLVSLALQQNYLPSEPSRKPIEFKYDTIT